MPERGRPVRHALPFVDGGGKELFSQVVEVVSFTSRTISLRMVVDLGGRRGQLGLGVMAMDGRDGQPTSIHVHVVHTSQETRRKPLHDSTRSTRLFFPEALAEESEQIGVSTAPSTVLK